MKPVHEVLKDAKALIEDPADWCQGQQATSDDKGGFTAPYCSVGALGKALEVFPGERNCHVAHGTPYGECVMVLDLVVGGSIVFFNDRTAQSHDCVLAAFDAAIEQTAPK